MVDQLAKYECITYRRRQTEPTALHLFNIFALADGRGARNLTPRNAVAISQTAERAA